MQIVSQRQAVHRELENKIQRNTWRGYLTANVEAKHQL